MRTAAKVSVVGAVVCVFAWVGARYGLDVLAVVLLFAMVPPVTVFPILYATRSPWWKTSTGRGLMLSGVAMLLLIDFAVLFRILDVPAPDWLRVVVYGVILASLCVSVWNLLRLQRQARRSS